MLGVDSSTQSTKALLVDADDGTILESSGAPHPPGTEVDPRAWLAAYDAATAGLADRAAALGVGRPAARHGRPRRGRRAGPRRPAVERHPLRGAPPST